MTAPNALAAITAALAADRPGVAAQPTPQAVFQFMPQAAVVPTIQVGPGVAPQTTAFNPFQPTPIQAAAAFVAAVPRAAEHHVHPQTGVPFAPINPPGEASNAPTVGLDAAPVQTGMPTLESVAELVGPFVQAKIVGAPAAEPPKAPRARRGRPPKAEPETFAQLGAQVFNAPTTAPTAGDGAVETAAESAAPSRTGPQSYTLEEQLAFATVEELAKELKRRGFRIGLSIE